MEEEYQKLLKHVKFSSGQKDLFALGQEVKKEYDGASFCIGDMISLTKPDVVFPADHKDGPNVYPSKIIKGILVLILDQGVCLLGDDIWTQVNLSNKSRYKLRLLYHPN